VQKVVPGPPSKDGTYTMTLVQMDDKTAGQPEQADAVEVLRDDVTWTGRLSVVPIAFCLIWMPAVPPSAPTR
jgi:hypothetical protein